MTVMRQKHAAAVGKMARMAAVAVLALAAAGASAERPAPGTLIDASNYERYRDHLTDGQVINIQKGQVYKIFETSPVEKLVYPKWLELTRQNAGKAVMLDEAGTWGLADGSPWPGGFPFPEPKNAREVMANFLYHLTPDDFDTNPPGGTMGGFSLIDKNGNEYKRFMINLTQVRMTSRAWVEPMPSFPGHEDELYRTHTIFFSPYDVAGLNTLNIIYRDQARLPDAYIYLPTFRRVRRLSTNQRADATAGSDLTAGDVDTFSDPLGLWDFKIIDRRPIVSAQNHAPSAEPLFDGTGKFLNGQYPSPYSGAEVRDSYFIEATPRYDTIYSKKILTVDAETFRPGMAEFYDRQGKLLKTYEIQFNIPDDHSPVVTWVPIKNQQTDSMTVFWVKTLVGNVGTPLRRVSVDAMKAWSR